MSSPATPHPETIERPFAEHMGQANWEYNASCVVGAISEQAIGGALRHPANSTVTAEEAKLSASYADFLPISYEVCATASEAGFATRDEKVAGIGSYMLKPLLATTLEQSGLTTSVDTRVSQALAATHDEKPLDVDRWLDGTFKLHLENVARVAYVWGRHGRVITERRPIIQYGELVTVDHEMVTNPHLYSTELGDKLLREVVKLKTQDPSLANRLLASVSPSYRKRLETRELIRRHEQQIVLERAARRKLGL